MKKIYKIIGTILAVLTIPSLILAVQISVPSAPSNGYMLVSTTTGAWTATSTIFLSPAGFFGVGTTTPFAPLSVMYGDDFIAHKVSPVFVIGSSTAGTATSTLFTVLSNGNVGIGTANPTQVLHVVGSSQFHAIYLENSAAAGFAILAVKNQAGSLGQFAISGPSNTFNTSVYGTNQMTYEANGAGGVLFLASNGTAGNNVIKFSRSTDAATTMTESMRIGGGGNVGIASTSPNNKLDVNGSAYFSGTSFFGGAITATSTLNVTGLATFTQASTTNIGSTGSAYFATSGGNVGIGNTTPAYLIDAQKNQNSATVLSVSNNNAGGASSVQWYLNNGTTNLALFKLGTGYTTSNLLTAGRGIIDLDSGTSGGAVGTSGNSPLLFYTNGYDKERWRIDASGNFISGTDNSYDIGASGATRPRSGYFGTTVSIAGATPLQFGAGNKSIDASGAHGTLTLLMAGSAGDDVLFDYGNIEKFRFAQTGNLGIGTSTPFATLSVMTGGTFASQAASTVFAIGSSTAGTATSTLFTVLSTGAVFAPKAVSSGNNQAAYWCADANGQFIQDSTVCLISALRYKQNIASLPSSLDTVMAIKPVSFYWKPDFNGAFQSNPNYSGEQVGFIADQVGQVDKRLMAVTTATSTFEGKTYPAGSAQTVNDRGLLATLWKAFQELVARVSGLEAKVNEQQKEIDVLTAKVNEISNKLAPK